MDQRTESAVNAAIHDLTITRIVIAHRLETLKQADRILVLDAGIKEYTAAAYSAVRQPEVIQKSIES